MLFYENLRSSQPSVAVFIRWEGKHRVNNLVCGSCAAEVGWGAHLKFLKKSIQSSIWHLLWPLLPERWKGWVLCGLAGVMGRIRPTQCNKVRGGKRMLHLLMFCRLPCSAASDFREKVPGGRSFTGLSKSIMSYNEQRTVLCSSCVAST